MASTTRALLCLLLILLVPAVESHGSDLIGVWEGRGLYRGLVVDGDTAFIAGGWRDVEVLNVANPGAMNLVDRWYDNDPESGDEVMQVAKDGDYLYACERISGVRVLRLADGWRPELVATIDPDDVEKTKASNLVVKNGILYYGDFRGGLCTVDVSDPENPVFLDRLLLPQHVHVLKEAQGLDVVGGYAYVANPWGGMAVVDVSNPANLFQVGYYDKPEGTFPGIWDVAVRDGFAYVLCQSYGVQVLDVSDPAYPVYVSEILLPYGMPDFISNDQPPLDVLLEGDIMFVSNGHDGVYVCDISNPYNPYVLEHIVLPTVPDETRKNYRFAWGLALRGQTLFVCSGKVGVMAYDVSEHFGGQPVSEPVYEPLQPPGGVALAGELVGGVLYAATGWSDLQTFDLSDPTNPLPLGKLSVVNSGEGYDVAVNGDVAYLAHRNGGLIVADVANPAAPFVIETIDTADRPTGLYLAPPYLYVADSKAGLRVYDVSAPRSPVHIGGLDLPGSALGVDGTGNLVYVAGYYKGVFVIDVTNPANPVRLARSSALSFVYDVLAAGDVVYATSMDRGVGVLDVSNPNDPVLADYVGLHDGSTTWSSPWSMTLAGSQLLVADGADGLAVFDVSTPGVLDFLGHTPLSGDARAVAADPERIAGLLGTDGIVSIPR
jgi:hypothetical protein